MSMLTSPNMAGLLAREHARDLRRLAGSPRLRGRRDIRHRRRSTPEPLSEQQADGIAALLNLLANPVRLRLISLIVAHQGGRVCVCELTEAFDLSPSAISDHLKVLHEAGLLDCDKRDVWEYYTARTEALSALATLIGTDRAGNDGVRCLRRGGPPGAARRGPGR